MSDEGEKTCPLCAEEMDLTDQQLKPCKCGYDICVWCWHHIMDMAEKDDTEGRCPACRTHYNKEKIVGTASKCERLVAEMSVEKKQKSQKGKSKPSEGRKQLSSVRVIQRNLVYIVGLPLNLADEDLLQRKEYFGQYGKVLKVSISRTASGSIQHFANSTCSVYITYSKEDEAVRSIQSVHGFVLEGRPLRACFGTTKYCHAWLRNMPCTNPDCLYLHEFGSQEDSFTKDEIISEYTRGRVQQVTGATNDVQRRSGSILPPVVEEYSNNNTSSWPKPISSKTTTNDTSNSMKGSSPPNSSSGMKGSPPNSSSGRSVALPAAASWGSNSQPVVTSNGSSKQKVDISTSSTTVSSSTVVTPLSNGNELQKKGSEDISTANGKDKVEHEVPESSDEERFHKLSSDMSSLALQPSEVEEPVNSSNKPAGPTLDNDVTGDMSYLLPDNKVEEEEEEVEADLLSFNDQRLMDPEVVTHTTSSYVQKNMNNSVGYSSQNHDRGSLLNTLNIPVVANGHSSSSVVNGDSFFGGGYNGHSHFAGNGGSMNNHIGIFEDRVKRDSNHIHSSNNNNGSINLGENSIISNILSMDFDPWDESLTSPRNLAKLLGNTSNKQQEQAQQRKTQNSNQSRFSFAREEDQTSSFTPNFSDYGRDLNSHNGYPGQVSDANGFSCFSFEESDRLAGSLSSFSSNKVAVSRSQISAPPGFMGGPSSRAPPPGFTANERLMEQTYDHLSGNHMFEASSLMRKGQGNHHQTAAPVYNNNGVSELELMDPAILAIGGSRLPTTDMMMRSSSIFPSQQHASYDENDSNNRLRLLMQRSFTQQNQRYSTDLGLGGGGDSYLARTDSYGRLLEQARSPSSYQQHGNFQQARSSRNGGREVHNQNGNGNDIAMAELLRNERLGFNKYSSYSVGAGGYEDTKFRMQPTSADLYNNTTFGI